MADLTIGGEVFRVEVEGLASGPVLVLSHSLGTDLAMWSGQMPALTKSFRVVRYDSRGHGASVAAERPVSLARLGTDVLNILDALEIDKAHWIGLSLGGAVGLWLLVNAPDRIRSAILANTAPKFGTPETWNARIGAVFVDGMKGNAEATIERWFSPGFAQRVPERVAAIRACLRSAAPRSYAACCAALRDMDLREALYEIEQEVLIISGRHDPVIKEKDTNHLLSRISRAKHVVLDAKHMSNIEAETAFNEAVIDFLNAQSAARTKRLPPKTAKVQKGTVPRGGVTRRTNNARNPLKKAPTKRAGAKTSRKSMGPTRSVDRQAVSTGARSSVQKKPAKKARPAAATARRSPSTTAARSPVRKTRSKRISLKPAAKKAAGKTPSKKPPAARRQPRKKPRRPSGRRKK